MLVIDIGFTALVLALSFFSGFGSFLQGKRAGRYNGYFDLLAELVLAAIVGLIVAYIGETQEIDRGYTCAAVLILSNNGSDTLLALKKHFIERFSGALNFGGKTK